MDDSYRYGAPSGQNPRGNPSGSSSALDSSRSSPSLPLYASGPSSAGAGLAPSSMVPGSFHQGGFASGAAQRHSFHIPPSQSLDQAMGGAGGVGGRSMGAPAQNTGLGHLGPHRTADAGVSPGRRSFGGETAAPNSFAGGGGAGLLPFRGFNLPSLHTTQSHDPAMHSGMNVDISDRERAARDAEWGARRWGNEQQGSSTGFLGRSASLGGRGKKDPYALPRDDIEGGLRGRDDDVDDEEEIDDEEIWADPYAAGYSGRSRVQPRGSQDSTGGPSSFGTNQYATSGYGAASGQGSIPPPLNMHLAAPHASGSMSAPASADATMSGPIGSPMSTTLSPMMQASTTSGTNGSRLTTTVSADPWPQYRQGSAASGGMQASPSMSHQRYGQTSSANVIDLSPLDQGDDPFGQRRQVQEPSSASAMFVDTRYSTTPMDTTPAPQSAGLNMPYLPADTSRPPASASYAPQRQQANRSRSQQQIQYAPQQGQPGRSQAQPGRPAENGHSAKRDRAARVGFRRVSVSDPSKDLKPRPVDPAASGRRADPNVPGAFLSPLKCLTSALTQTYNICSPSFIYETAHNPRRVLTKPSKACHNGGFDNEDYDYILYVNDMLTADNGTGDKYLILDVLGQGTFGQVVKCQNMRTNELVAVKVVKNKPAYLNQSMMEVAILQLLNNEHDKNDEHHLLRMKDHFIHKRHLCLVFECLASNLYELIKHNQFRGLSLQLVKMFTTQLLDALKVLKDARLIHCDLKPENILLKSLNSPQIKIIDFGSACHERQTVYTYIQSRFYRSPEVLLGLPYSSAIDMWSLGCIVVELFLGLPLFPGTSEYNQLSRITEMLGSPPQHLLEVGKQVHEFFNINFDPEGRKRYRLKPMDQYANEHNTQEQPSKQYFKATRLPEIIRTYPLPKKVVKQTEIDKEMSMRAAFIDFVRGLLDMDPITRWSPQQAEKHPFITGERFTGHWEPGATAGASSRPASSAGSDSRAQQKKYGGLVSTPQQSRGQRAYPDAAAYNQQLAQHQSYTAQQQQQAAAAQRHPFADESMQYSGSNAHRLSVHQNQQMRPHQAQPRIPSHGNGLSVSSSSSAAFPTRNYAPPVANPPPTSYYPTTRNRANTINQMDQIPPALARLTHLGVQDPAGTRSSLTPVLNRDEAIREWERRGHAKRLSINPNNPQLEYLQEQAEMAGQGWAGNYGGMPSYPMQPALSAGMEDYGRGGGSRHRATLSTSSDFGFPDASGSHYSGGMSSPRRHGGMGGGSHSHSQSSSNQNYLPAFPPPAASAFDSYDPRGDASMALMYTPMQPNAAPQSGMQRQMGPPPPMGHHRQAASMHQFGQTNNPFGQHHGASSAGNSPMIPQGHLSPGQQQQLQQQGRRASGGQYGGGAGGFGDYEP